MLEREDSKQTFRNSHLTPYEQELPTKIKTVIRALGTMIIIPDYDKDVNDLMSKPIYKGGIQQPILKGVDRDKAVKKLVELIDQL